MVVSAIKNQNRSDLELQRRERQLAVAHRLAKLGSWELDVASNQVSWSENEGFLPQSVPKSGEFEMSLDSFLECVLEEERPRIIHEIESAIDRRGDFSFECQIVRTDGTNCIFQFQGEVESQGRRAVRLIGFSQDITKRKHAEAALNKSEDHYKELFYEACVMQEHLRDVSKKIIKKQEEERARISRELHDEIGQSLTAINVNLAMLRKSLSRNASEAEKILEDTRSMLEQTMVVVHDFARELRPSMLDDLGLTPALRSYAKKFTERTGIAVDFQAPRQTETIDNDNKTVLYRIVQESLTNVAKHADANMVRIQLHFENERARLVISDDGRSFDVEKALTSNNSGRLGLLGMKERVELVKGSLSITSKPGEGSRIEVRL